MTQRLEVDLSEVWFRSWHPQRTVPASDSKRGFGRWVFTV